MGDPCYKNRNKSMNTNQSVKQVLLELAADRHRRAYFATVAFATFALIVSILIVSILMLLKAAALQANAEELRNEAVSVNVESATALLHAVQALKAAEDINQDSEKTLKEAATKCGRPA